MNDTLLKTSNTLDIEKEKNSCKTMGIIGLITSFIISILSLPFNIIAIVKGSKIKKATGKTETGLILGIIGVIIGIISLCIIIFYIFVAVKLFNDITDNDVNTYEKTRMISQVSNTLNSVSSLDDNTIYKLDDLVSLNLISKTSPFRYNYIDTSYVSKIGGEIEFCLIDENHNGVVYSSTYDKETMEYIDNKDDLKYTNLNKKCKFRISKIQAQKYLKQKLDEKYNQDLEIIDCESFGSSFYNSDFGLTCEFNNGVKATLYYNKFPEYEEK